MKSRILDVSHDPSSRTRAGVPDAALAEAGALGFSVIGYTASVTALGLPGARESTFVDMVLAAADPRMVLALSWAEFLGCAAYTMLGDGTILITEMAPPPAFRWARWGVHFPEGSGVLHELVESTRVAHVVAHHEERLRACSAAPVLPHDVRTQMAIRIRSREIGDRRMGRQVRIALAMSFAAMALVAVAGGLLAKRFPDAAVAVGFAALSAALVVWLPAFIGSLKYVAPFLARIGGTPPRRSAGELLLAAGASPPSMLPPESEQTPPAPVRRAPVRIAIHPAELARLRQLDLLASLASAVVYPMGALLATVLVGSAGWIVAFGVVSTFDGLARMVSKKSRTDLVREKLVPELVRIEGEAGVACADGACGIPSKWSGRVTLGLGVCALFTALDLLSSPRDAAPAWLVAQWALLVPVFAAGAVTRTKKRHAQLVA